MATKSRSSKGGTDFKIRTVNKKADRKQGGFYLRLKTDEWMKAYALFTPNPEEDGNTGWYEYFEHYDKSSNQYVPCIGDDCYMCELGENPSTRALTLWYFPDNPEKEQLKVFKMNGYLIRDFVEVEEEEGGVLGKKFRIKRLSDKGEYRATVQGAEKPLLKKEISRLLKLAIENGMDFEKLVLAQAKAAYAKQSAVDALTDDDEDDDDEDEDEEEEEAPKARRGKAAPKGKAKDDDDDEDDEDEDEEDEEEDEDEEDENDDDDDDDDEDDEDEDEDEDEDDDDDDDEEEAESSDEISGTTFAVVSTSESDETITVKIDGKNAKLWVGEGVDVDWDTVKKGVEITVDALKDDEGDWVLTSLKKKAARRSAKK